MENSTSKKCSAPGSTMPIIILRRRSPAHPPQVLPALLPEEGRKQFIAHLLTLKNEADFIPKCPFLSWLSLCHSTAERCLFSKAKGWGPPRQLGTAWRPSLHIGAPVSTGTTPTRISLRFGHELGPGIPPPSTDRVNAVECGHLLFHRLLLGTVIPLPV